MSAQGSDFQEELLVGFLNSDHEMHHKYGASSIARTCTSARSKGAIGKLGGAQRLVVLLKRYVRNGQASNHGTESNNCPISPYTYPYASTINFQPGSAQERLPEFCNIHTGLRINCELVLDQL